MILKVDYIMRKSVITLLIAILLLSMASCKKNIIVEVSQESISTTSSDLSTSINQTPTSSVQNTSAQLKTSSERKPNLSSNSTVSESELNIDKGLFDVKITIPKSFLGDNEITELTDEQKSQGFKSMKKNDDGSITYTISKNAHKSLMEEMKKTTSDQLKKMATDGTYISIKDVSFNDNFSKITLLVDEEKFNNSFDSFATLAVGMSGMMYQIFDGSEASKTSVTIELTNNITQEVFSTVKYPDAINK